MKFTIIPDDGFVSKDGAGYTGLTFTIDGTVHAVQWYEDFGEIEYKTSIVAGKTAKPANEGIIEFDRFTAALDAWQVALNLEIEAQEEKIRQDNAALLEN